MRLNYHGVDFGTFHIRVTNDRGDDYKYRDCCIALRGFAELLVIQAEQRDRPYHDQTVRVLVDDVYSGMIMIERD